jgi:hypothetical protein
MRFLRWQSFLADLAVRQLERQSGISQLRKS